MENKITKEFIGAFRVNTQSENYNVRCWREENTWDKETIKRNREEISQHIARLKGTETMEEVANYLLAMDRMNAVEVLEVLPKANGIVLYRNWP